MLSETAFLLSKTTLMLSVLKSDVFLEYYQNTHLRYQYQQKYYQNKHLHYQFYLQELFRSPCFRYFATAPLALSPRERFFLLFFIHKENEDMPENPFVKPFDGGSLYVRSSLSGLSRHDVCEFLHCLSRGFFLLRCA